MAQIDLGGKTRTLKYTYGAIRLMEREAGGIGIATLLGPERRGFDTMLLTVWAGLKHENKGLTTGQVEKWLDDYLQSGGTFQALDILTTQALIESGIFGKQDEGNS